jgi:hypothetical protein
MGGREDERYVQLGQLTKNLIELCSLYSIYIPDSTFLFFVNIQENVFH